MQLQTSVHWSTQWKVRNGSSNVAEPFPDPNPVTERHRLLGLVQYAAFSCYSFYAKRRRKHVSALCDDGGPKLGADTNYASSSTASNHALRNSHSCECIGPLRVSNQSEHNLRNSAQRSWQQLCEHANILFLSVSFSCYAKSGPIVTAHSVPLDHTGSMTYLC